LILAVVHFPEEIFEARDDLRLEMIGFGIFEGVNKEEALRF
jgi:hypothetical protein